MRVSDWSSDVCSSDRGEMIALGDELGADDDVDQPGLDMGDELGRFGGRPQGVAGDDRGPGLREAQLYLVGDAFAAGGRAEERRVGKECVRTCSTRRTQ